MCSRYDVCGVLFCFVFFNADYCESTGLRLFLLERKVKKKALTKWRKSFAKENVRRQSMKQKFSFTIILGREILTGRKKEGRKEGDIEMTSLPILGVE